MEGAGGDGEGTLRLLEPHWNHGMIAASIAISLLGAFTSTQLMCQARVSVGFNAVLVWTLLASLTFGFCSIWSLHFVATLAYELDILVGINVPLTILSSVLAVVFTFAALGSDLLWEAYFRERRKRKGNTKRWKTSSSTKHRQRGSDPIVEVRPLLNHAEDSEDISPESETPDMGQLERQLVDDVELDENRTLNDNNRVENGAVGEPVRKIRTLSLMGPSTNHLLQNPSLVQDSDLTTETAESTTGLTESGNQSASGRSSSIIGSSSTSTFGLSGIMNIAFRSTAPAKNVFIATGEALYKGCTGKNFAKGFLWSLAITSMHYAGLGALDIPSGYCTLDYGLVFLSGIISWVVCIVGCILMSQMETHLNQQILFSFTATTGVAGMHFTGMRAATFWTRSPPTDARGYPPALAIAVVSIAIATCIAANGLLAHAVTVSRNKLAEIVLTRKKLWRTIAQKENAEAAAAARSDFIASASHEIRTPLHHLQGYSDLLSQTELTEEGRSLLYAIQRATKTLSLITNNVLDWSKLERDSGSICRPVALDIRTVCEAILVLLPNKDDEAEVEIFVVVKPDVPKSMFLDETYIHRILMNLLSNALKFTRSGYILLLVEVADGKLVATVKDTGPGVPPSFLPQLFEPFKQAQTRGNHRGTGLGLSIVKQLLYKMNGTISVESRHPEAEQVQPDQTGSTFTISIPVQSITETDASNITTLPKICILHNSNERSVEGLQMAWEKFGFEVIFAKEFASIPDLDWKYIWADLSFLKENPSCLRVLLEQDKCPVLVPCDTMNSLLQIPQLGSAPRCVPLPRPLVWHSFAQRIAAASQDPVKPELSRTVRFASTVDLVNKSGKLQTHKPTEKNLLIMLVEDNPINQKLGQKMLTSLGYKVQTAENGQEAINQIIEHDQRVDAILMDQSMPVKDGITATREIRELEAAGTLARRRPIIAVTAVVSSQAQALFMAAGADDFLAKPLSLAKLERTLSTHLPAN